MNHPRPQLTTMPIQIEPYHNYSGALLIGVGLGSGPYVRVLTRAEATALRDALDVALLLADRPVPAHFYPAEPRAARDSEWEERDDV